MPYKALAAVLTQCTGGEEGGEVKGELSVGNFSPRFGPLEAGLSGIVRDPRCAASGWLVVSSGLLER